MAGRAGRGIALSAALPPPAFLQTKNSFYRQKNSSPGGRCTEYGSVRLKFEEVEVDVGLESEVWKTAQHVMSALDFGEIVAEAITSYRRRPGQ